MILDSEIPKCPGFEFKSKKENFFKNQNLLEEHSVKIYEIDPYFIKMGVNICYFELISECFLAVEIDEKGHTDRDIIFEKKKDKKH